MFKYFSILQDFQRYVIGCALHLHGLAMDLHWICIGLAMDLQLLSRNGRRADSWGDALDLAQDWLEAMGPAHIYRRCVCASRPHCPHAEPTVFDELEHFRGNHGDSNGISTAVSAFCGDSGNFWGMWRFLRQPTLHVDIWCICIPLSLIPLGGPYHKKTANSSGLCAEQRRSRNLCRLHRSSWHR